MKYILPLLLLVGINPIAYANCELTPEGQKLYLSFTITGCDSNYCISAKKNDGVELVDLQKAVYCDEAGNACAFRGKYFSMSMFIKSNHSASFVVKSITDYRELANCY